MAALRYDKRGIAASRAAGPDEKELSFDIFIDDAVAWIQKLRGDPRCAGVAGIGHSEGSLVGMAAVRRAGARAFVSIAGAGQPLYETILEQLRARAPGLVTDAESIIASLRRGQTVAEVEPELAGVFRPSAQPFLISLFRRDPSLSLANGLLEAVGGFLRESLR